MTNIEIINSIGFFIFMKKLQDLNIISDPWFLESDTITNNMEKVTVKMNEYLNSLTESELNRLILELS